MTGSPILFNLVTVTLLQAYIYCRKKTGVALSNIKQIKQDCKNTSDALIEIKEFEGIKALAKNIYLLAMMLKNMKGVERLC